MSWMKHLMLLGILLVMVTGCQATNRVMGENRGDMSITAAVKERLAQERFGTVTDINVDTRDGTVYLRGAVPTGEEKMRAARAARDVAGVQRVVNELRVESQQGRAPTGQEMSDAR